MIEYNSDGSWTTYIYANGQKIAKATSTGALNYYLDDHLGTTQVELDASGNVTWSGQFTPFGAELDAGGTTMHYKFTGKERDAESGLDYFGARYYGSSMGRWMSPDWAQKPEAVPYSKLADPQSLNLYGYAGNNPLSRIDSDGHVVIDKGITYVYYPVSGSTANEAIQNSSTHFDGQFGGQTVPTFGVERFKPILTQSGQTVTATAPSDDQIQTTLAQTITLPSWKSSDPEQQAAFDASIAKLKAHEETHAADNRAVAETLDKSIPGTSASATAKNPQAAADSATDKLTSKVQDKVNAAVTDSNQRAKALDDKTDHGRNP